MPCTIFNWVEAIGSQYIGFCYEAGGRLWYFVDSIVPYTKLPGNAARGADRQKFSSNVKVNSTLEYWQGVLATAAPKMLQNGGPN